jgi:hypothetical protein
VPKFQIGDRVKVLAHTCPNQAGGAIGLKGQDYVGKTFIIEVVSNILPAYYLKEDWSSFIWDERLLRRIRKAPKIAPSTNISFSVEILEMRNNLAKLADNNPGLCSFAKYVSKNNKGRAFMHYAAPCHANIDAPRWGEAANFQQGGVVEALILNIEGHRRKFITAAGKTKYTRFVDYIIHRSPFKSAFVPVANIEDYFKLGVVCRTDVPSFIIKAGAVALREKTEFPGSFIAFNKLLELGHSENTAELLSACLYYDNGWIFKDFQNGHQVWHADHQADCLLAFMKRGYTERQLAEPPYRKSAIDTGIAKHIAPTEGEESISSYIKSALKIKAAKAMRWAEPVPVGVSDDLLHTFAKELDKLL